MIIDEGHIKNLFSVGLTNLGPKRRRTSLLTLASLVCFSPTFVDAYQVQEVFKIKDYRLFLNPPAKPGEAERQGLGAKGSENSPNAPKKTKSGRVEPKVRDEASLLKMTNLERVVKNELILMRLNDFKKFYERRMDLSQSDLYRGWLNEVEMALRHEKLANAKVKAMKDGRDLYSRYLENTPVDIARKIAKKQMFELVRKKWGDLKNSIYNETSPDNKVWSKGGQTDTIRRLNDHLVFVPASPRSASNGKKEVFTFRFADWGAVSLDKGSVERAIPSQFKKRVARAVSPSKAVIVGQVRLEFNSYNAFNRLEEGVAEIEAEQPETGVSGDGFGGDDLGYGGGGDAAADPSTTSEDGDRLARPYPNSSGGQSFKGGSGGSIPPQGQSGAQLPDPRSNSMSTPFSPSSNSMAPSASASALPKTDSGNGGVADGFSARSATSPYQPYDFDSY
jgi:hypothetical protein